MMFENICRLYSIGTLRSFTPITPGTVARVWKLETEVGIFLLRTLTGEGQGAAEWALFSHLREHGFDRCPTILTTRDGAPMAELDGVWYQMQEFCSGKMPDPVCTGVPAAIARTIRLLNSAMPHGTIHGDLGLWNMVLTENGSIAVIDFGDARPGDPYFDYAAALGGLINHSPAGERRRICTEFLRELDADRHRLLSQLRLWADEGIARWNSRSETMVRRFQFALCWAEENLYEL